MFDLQVLNLNQSFLFVDLKAVLPLFVEVTHQLFADLHVLFHLRLLDVGTQVILVKDDFSLKQSHFLHQVFVQLVLVNFAALLSEQLHFLFDNRENHNLLILIEHTVATLVKDFQKLVG